MSRNSLGVPAARAVATGVVVVLLTVGCSDRFGGAGTSVDGPVVSLTEDASGVQVTQCDASASVSRADAAAKTGAESNWAAPCATYAKTICQRMLDCGPWAFWGNVGGLQNCQDRVGGAACERQMCSPGSNVTPGALIDCAAALGGQTCAQRQVNLPAVCSWAGSLADNSGCLYDNQCQSRRCDRAGDGVCGLCMPLSHEGEACDFTRRSCESGFACVENSGRWACAQLLSEGASCNSRTQCARHLACIGGRCTPSRNVGEPCSIHLDCTYEQDVTCLPAPSGAGQVCTFASHPAPGETCDSTRGMFCSGRGACKDASGSLAVSGVCCAAIGDGQPCDGSTPCLYGAACRGGICTTAGLVASSCN